MNLGHLIKEVTLPVHLTVGPPGFGETVCHLGDLVLPWPIEPGWRAELAGLLRDAADEIENPTDSDEGPDAARWIPDANRGDQ